MHPTLLQHKVFGLVVNVAVERHGVGDTQQRGVIDEPLFPPAAAEMSRCTSGIRGRSSAMASSASSICLCGTRRDSTATRGVADRGAASVCAGASVESVAHHRDVLRTHTETGQVSAPTAGTR